MNTFSLCRNGVTSTALSEKLSLEELIQFIKDHPEAALINALRNSPYKGGEYKKYKQILPYVTPHATFHGRRKAENVDQLSGFIYLDIDKDSLPNGVEVMKQYILEHHVDKVAIMGTSVGGSGIFFYVRIANPEVVTQENFDSVYDYVRRIVFHDISTDANASGISRTHIIPADPGVYTNLNAGIVIPDSVLENTKPLTNCNKYTNTGCTVVEKFLDIKEVIQRIKWNTAVDVGDKDILVQDIECSKLFIPRVIPDGKKHSIYRAIVNSIVFNNPDIELLVILSFINFINTHRTEGKPMEFREMKRMVKAEYNRILDTGEIKGTKNKRYHANPKYDRNTKLHFIAKARGGEQRQNSISLITDAVMQLKKESADKVTINKVAKLLEGKLSPTTINRYYRTVVPKRIVD